jgi:predicted CXXCH cytochrome family protein
VPIVYNTQLPTNPLAGGNFYWVGNAGFGDAYGHNVNGIATQDLMLTKANGAPGVNPSGCADSCHYTLADPPNAENSARGSCQGCHVFTYHHEDNNVYRFLKGHGTGPSTPFSSERKDITINTDYVKGIEDNDWEQETAVDHNWYKGTGDRYVTEGDTLATYQTVTSFCVGCHSKFHGWNKDNKNPPYDKSPWIRHPADLLLPNEGEYSGYDPSDDAKYSAEAPVGWINPSTPVRSEAVVMCLSCHRPHGSDQPDMLRWDYNTMIAGGTSTDTGCFTCHTSKNVAP